jgi:hypothetical protein
MRSHDAGLTWSVARTLARTNGDSDHPLLVARGSVPFLSWFTSTDGYRLLRLP